MKAHIETVGKKLILTVYYDKARRDWNAAIERGLRAYGLKKNKVTIIAKPLPANAQEGHQ